MKKYTLHFSLLFAISISIAATINWNQLFQYNLLPIPTYIQKDNLPAGTSLNNEIITLGRILFYD